MATAWTTPPLEIVLIRGDFFCLRVVVVTDVETASGVVVGFAILFARLKVLFFARATGCVMRARTLSDQNVAHVCLL